MKLKNVFWGIFFIASAAFIVANQLGYFYGLGLPFLILLIIMVPIVVKSIAHLNYFGIVFPIAILFAAYNRSMELVDLSIWAILLAALFLSIGLSILFGNRWHKRGVFYHHYDHSHGGGFHGPFFGRRVHRDVEETTDDLSGDVIRIHESFGESSKYVNSEALDRLEIRASFGSVKVYFSDAQLKSDMAEVYLDVTFAGIELYVPKNWRVENNVNGTFAGVDEKNRNYAGVDAPVLNLTGGLSFSGVEIIYV